MQLTYFLAATTFAASALGATFKNFEDKSCQRWDGTFVPLTAAQQQAIVEQNFPTSIVAPEASRFFSPSQRERCPSNSDDTYRWVDIPPWQEFGNPRGGGGAIAVVYYKETDTYNACTYLASSQFGSYAGSCK